MRHHVAAVAVHARKAIKFSAIRYSLYAAGSGEAVTDTMVGYYYGRHTVYLNVLNNLK